MSHLEYNLRLNQPDDMDSEELEQLKIEIANEFDNENEMLANENHFLDENDGSTDMELYQLFHTLDGNEEQENAPNPDETYFKFDNIGAEVEVEDQLIVEDYDDKQPEQQNFQMIGDQPVMFFIEDPSVQVKKKIPSVQLSPPKLKAPDVHPLKPFPFLYKLYLVANSSFVNYVSWSEDGLAVELHYLELQYHLASEENIFKCTNVLYFINQLVGHGFERVPTRENKLPQDPFLIILIYQHQHFVRDKPEKLQWIAEQIFVEAEDNLPTNATARPLAVPSTTHVTRMSGRGDHCCKFLTTRSSLQIARGRLYTILRYTVDSKLLKDRGSSSEVLAELVPRRGRGSVTVKQPNSITTLPTLEGVKYVKPHESGFNIPTGQTTEYAGYFGNLDVAQVKEFFGDYLPRYGQSRTDIIMDATNRTGNFHQNLPIGINYSEDEDEGEMLQCSSMKIQKLIAPSSSQELKTEAIDGSIEEFMAEICGESTGNSKDMIKLHSTDAVAPKTKATANSKPKVRKKRKLPETTSTEEDDEEVILKSGQQLHPLAIKKKDITEEQQEGKVLNPDMHKSPEDEKEKINTGNEDSEEEDDFDDDDDYIDKNVEYRTTKQQLNTPRRYDLRNTKRPTKRYLS